MKDKITLVISLLGATLILSLVFLGLLALNEVPAPDILELVVVGALTAITGILSRPDKQDTGDRHDVEQDRLF